MARFDIDEYLETKGFIYPPMQRKVLKILSERFQYEIRQLYRIDEDVRSAVKKVEYLLDNAHKIIMASYRCPLPYYFAEVCNTIDGDTWEKKFIQHIVVYHNHMSPGGLSLMNLMRAMPSALSTMSEKRRARLFLIEYPFTRVLD